MPHKREYVPLRITHGRHCTCSACARQDWSEPQLAPCGMHGEGCPALYQPLGPAGVRVDPATARVARATAREEAGVPDGLVSALNILEYGCDEGDYDEEVQAVTDLLNAARWVVDAHDQHRGEVAALDRLREVVNNNA